MIKNYFKIAWRNLWKYKTYSSLNVFGLALGMAVAVLIGLWVNEELSYNSYFQNRDQIARVLQHQTFNGITDTDIIVPRPLEMALRNEYTSYFKQILMSRNSSDHLKYGDKNISRKGYFTQEGLPEMLNLEILKGVKNGLTAPHSIMLSNSCAKALFGTEDPIGKVIEVSNEYRMKVTGVYMDIPYNNSFQDVDYIMPWKFFINTQPWIKNAADNWNNNSFQLFVQIADNTSMEKVSAAIKDIKKNASSGTRQYNPEFELLPMNDWYLRSHFQNGMQDGGRIEYVWLFGAIGVFVLLLACINFMNLSTARSEKRGKEVGIRKTIGSGRKQLIGQFLSESLMVVFLAFLMALVLVLAALPGFNNIAMAKIVFPWGSAAFWFASVSIIGVTALVSGSYPALFLSSFRPVSVLKGTFKGGKYATWPRKILVITQFTISTVLIIGTITVLQQINFSKNRSVGYDKAGLIQIPFSGPDFYGNYEQMRNAFLRSGAVAEMSSSSSPTTGVWSTHDGYTWEGKPQDFQEEFVWTRVSFDYARSLNLNFISGRDFSRDFASDSNAIIINKTAAKYMGLKDPVGKYLRPETTDSNEEPMKIIGVVDDIIMESPYEPIRPTVFAFDKYQTSNFYNLRLQPDKSIHESLQTIEKVFKEHFPQVPFNYQFIDEEYARKFATEERIASLAGMFTVLAILISCLGLFGLTSFVAEQRTKELGVRKVLGATVAHLWFLLSRDFILLVLISLLIASPMAYYFMSAWTQKYTYRIDLSLWVFLTAGAGALTIAMVTVSFQAVKAALENPVKSLKTE